MLTQAPEGIEPNDHVAKMTQRGSVEYVCGFLVSGGCVALVLKSRPEWQRGRWNGVGGKIEPGETPRQAIAREFKEETGADTFESDWSHRVTLSFDGGRVYFFLARMVAPPLLSGCADEPVQWHPLTNLPCTIPNLRWVIPMCFDDDLRFPVEVFDKSIPEVNGATVREKRLSD